MLYQLPSGETIEISLEEYLSLSDEAFDRYIRLGKFSSITYSQFDHKNYRRGSSGLNYDFSVLEEDEVELHDNRTLSQKLDEMEED
jgi:hypothetical protein